MDSQRIAFLFSKEEYFSKSILDLVKRKKGMIKQEKWGVFLFHESTDLVHMFDRYHILEVPQCSGLN